MPEVVTITPPAALYQATSGPDWTPKTNKELARWAIETDKALMQCNADKAAIATYVQSVASRKSSAENGR